MIGTDRIRYPLGSRRTNWSLSCHLRVCHARPRAASGLIAIFLAATCSAGTATTRAAQPAAPEPESVVRAEFVVAITLFARLHEMGQVIIRDFQLPLLGTEEGSGDRLAAMTLLGGGGPGTKPEEMRRLTRALA